MNYISVFIRKNLHFNMSGILHKPFQIHGIIGEGMDRLLLCCLKQFGKFLFISGYTHSFSTAAAGCLDHNRKTDFLYSFQSLLYCVDRFLCAGHYRDFSFPHCVFRLRFISHSGNYFCGRTNKCHITFLTHFHKTAVL